MTVLSTTPRLSTSKIPRTITASTTNTEIAKSTKNIDVITEKYSKKNIKGSRHFERYSENSTTEDDIITSSVTVSEKETENFFTTKKTVNYTETTEEDIDVIILSNDIVTDIDNDTTSTLSNEPIVSDATLKYNVEDVVSSKSIESTDRYSSDMYYDTEESKVDNATDNISSLSSQLNEGLYETLYQELHEGFEGYATENFTDKYERLEAAIVSNITTPSFPTDPENSTNTKYFSDPYNYFEKSQSDVAINNIITSTSPTQSNLEEDENTKYSTTYLSYKESTTNLEYSPALINENVRENSSITMTPVRDERFSATTKIGNVI